MYSTASYIVLDLQAVSYPDILVYPATAVLLHVILSLHLTPLHPLHPVHKLQDHARRLVILVFELNT